MNRPPVSVLLSCLLLGALVFWASYRVGRGDGRTPAPGQAERPAQSGARARTPHHASSRLAQAAQASYQPPGEASLEALRKRFAHNADKSNFHFDAETLALIATLAPEQCAEAARIANSLPNAHRTAILSAVLARWAHFAPEAAAAFATDEASPYEIRHTLAAVYQSWARRHPEAALAHHESVAATGRFLPAMGLHSVLADLFFAWGQTDTAAAAEAAQVLADRGGSYFAWIGIAGLAETEEFRDRAIEATLSLEDENARTKALGRVIGQWAGREPHAAAAWLDENNYHDQSTQWAVAQRFTRIDPEGNADWLLRRAAPENRDQALSMALNGWARSDVQAAASWLEKTGPTDRGIEIIAQVYATIDLAKGVAWAQRASAENRDDIIAGALAHARQFDLNLDVEPYLAAGSLSAEAMRRKIEELARSHARF